MGSLKWMVYNGKSMRHLLKLMIWGYLGYPHFRTPPYISNVLTITRGSTDTIHPHATGRGKATNNRR